MSKHLKLLKQSLHCKSCRVNELLLIVILRVPVDLEDVSKFPNLFAELIRRGYSDEDVAKIARLNLIRVLQAVEKVCIGPSGLPRTQAPPLQKSREEPGYEANSCSLFCVLTDHMISHTCSY